MLGRCTYTCDLSQGDRCLLTAHSALTEWLSGLSYINEQFCAWQLMPVVHIKYLASARYIPVKSPYLAFARSHLPQEYNQQINRNCKITTVRIFLCMIPLDDTAIHTAVFELLRSAFSEHRPPPTPSFARSLILMFGTG